MEQKRQNCSTIEKSVCPKYIICDCPQLHLNEYRRTDVGYTIEKLRELVSDPVTSDQTPRILRLLCDYLHRIGDEGYPVKHLPAIIKVLEFLAWNSREIDDYRVHLNQMLQLCNRPPLLKHTSESLVISLVMEHYFTCLGYLLTILPFEEDVQRIYNILDCLLIGRTKSTNVAAVKLDFRRRAMENSKLPIIIVELLNAAMSKMYPKMLELAYILVSVSNQCCYRMLEAGILNTLLTRMDLPYATQPCCRPPDIPLEGEEYPRDTMLLIIKLLWSLMRSALPPKTLPEHLKDIPSPKQCAMWYSLSITIIDNVLFLTQYRGLRYSFKRQILYGQYCATNLRIRNDIAALILAGIVVMPSWNLASSGIAEDIVKLLSAIESGITKIWTKNIKFSDSTEDLFFKKTLLMIIAHLADIDIYVFIMKKATIMPIILRIIKFCLSNKKDKGSLILLEYAMHILSLLAPRIETEFIKNKGTFILLAMLEQILNMEFDEHLAMIFMRTICSIILQDNVLLLENFQKYGMISLLIKLINNIVSLNKLTIRRQRILTLLLIALEGLVRKPTSVQHMCEQQSVDLVIEIFTKCLYPKNEDFQVDERLLLAIGSYIWKCVAQCPANLQIFLKNGGLYSMLDIIEIASYPVKCLYLGALTDICDNTFCGPYLCTWRGTDKKIGLMSLLATIWREEEDKIGIKRHIDGSIADPELPQMGTKQWIDTYHTQLSTDVSPTIIDMFGSVRSRIFSILKIIERNDDRYEMAKKHYKILLDELSTKDRITLCCVDMYLRLKLGQMWTELSRYLEQADVIPLNVDANLIAHMVQWHHSWGILIQDRQRKLIAATKRADEIFEKDEFAKIRDSKLAPALEALSEVDLIRRTTDRSYRLRKKNRQRRQVHAALSFPREADAEQCHRTFSDKTNVTVILGQHQSIDTWHLEDAQKDCTEISPVSLLDSPHEEIFSSLEATSSKLLSGDSCFTLGL
ncbi:cilia- and flagella-associated protein 69-like [Pogonomyrmex barbatus]|uniref:Cilia- and flagella-associated protein 69-like n=1 Tax=Pogonomyrmex barbatus TaxID=144034 RepID=A0A8N1S5Y2_9HYME|nr:cilia- and flagella-associated protein 69-like [Pogonomyrmex barbatus]